MEHHCSGDRAAENPALRGIPRDLNIAKGEKLLGHPPKKSKVPARRAQPFVYARAVAADLIHSPATCRVATFNRFQTLMSAMARSSPDSARSS